MDVIIFNEFYDSWLETWSCPQVTKRSQVVRLPVKGFFRGKSFIVYEHGVFFFSYYGYKQKELVSWAANHFLLLLLKSNMGLWIVGKRGRSHSSTCRKKFAFSLCSF